MSSRALRKLQEAAEAEAATKSEAQMSDDQEAPTAGGRSNQFALLMMSADDGADSSNDEDANDEAEDDAGDVNGDAKAASTLESEKVTKKRSQKSKKKANKKRQSKKGGESKADKDEDEFAGFEVTPKATPVPDSRSAVGGGGSSKPLLGVELRLLDGGQELRRLFGSATGESGMQRQSRNVGATPGSRRRGLLVQPKPTWPPVVRLGVSMSPEQATFGSDAFPAGSSVHRFEHSREYQRTQLAFTDAVASGQPERLSEILRRQPYHIDSLLQLAEVFRLQEDSATAADLVERALHALECAMSPGFTLVSDRCRLSFARRENRPIFTALLRHALALAGKCCHRACLETCKLLLSLSPTADPMGALLLLDSACLMCGQEEYLLRLMQAWESSRHLSQLPNWAYSGALARFRLGRADADSALDEALMLFPSILTPLLAKLSVDPGPQISGCRLFSGTETSTGLRQLCGLYLQRCGHCWKEAPAVSFLVAGAARVAAAASATPPTEPRLAEYAERRRRRYRRTPLNVLRHLVVSEARDALADLPPDIDPAGLNAFDPLPPPDTVCDYDLDSLRRRLGASRGGGGPEDEDGLLAAFLRSMLPNYDPNAPQNPQQAAAAGAAGGGGALAGLLDSVRQLLNGLGPPEAPPAADGGGPGPQDEGADEGGQ